MLEIKDSVAVITGGASGLGYAIAQYWVEQGGKVVLGDVAAHAGGGLGAALAQLALVVVEVGFIPTGFGVAE